MLRTKIFDFPRARIVIGDYVRPIINFGLVKGVVDPALARVEKENDESRDGYRDFSRSIFQLKLHISRQ